jgi:dihydrofolate synthase/folylpolyglutamate synthase
MVHALEERGMLPTGPEPTADAVRQGLAAARWPGRLERHQWRGHRLLIDGAHNPPAAVALRQELDRLPSIGTEDGGGRGGRRWLLGIQRHKEGAEMVGALLGEGDRAAIVPVPGHASWSAAELAAALPHLAPRLQTHDTLLEGLHWLTEGETLPVVAGSLYLVGAVLALLDSDS